MKCRKYPCRLLGLCFVCFTITTCKTPQYRHENVSLPAVIRWGILDSTQAFSGYQLSSNGELDSVYRASPFDAVQIAKKYGQVPADTVAWYMQRLRALFLTNRILAVRVGPKTAVLEYEQRQGRSPLLLRAFWDPRYENAGNRQFRALYAQLENLRQQLSAENSR